MELVLHMVVAGALGAQCVALEPRAGFGAVRWEPPPMVLADDRVMTRRGAESWQVIRTTMAPPMIPIDHWCDGENQVLWEDPFDVVPGANCHGVLALGGFCARPDSNGDGFGEIYDADIVFQKGLDRCDAIWGPGSAEEIVTHEEGHTIGLGHSPDPTATMFHRARFDGRGSQLAPPDLAGLAALYGIEVTLPSPRPSPAATPTPVISITRCCRGRRVLVEGAATGSRVRVTLASPDQGVQEARRVRVKRGRVKRRFRWRGPGLYGATIGETTGIVELK